VPGDYAHHRSGNEALRLVAYAGREFRASIWRGNDFTAWEDFMNRTQSTIAG
jgi:hypothetical protein